MFNINKVRQTALRALRALRAGLPGTIARKRLEWHTAGTKDSFEGVIVRLNQIALREVKTRTTSALYSWPRGGSPLLCRGPDGKTKALSSRKAAPVSSGAALSLASSRA